MKKKILLLVPLALILAVSVVACAAPTDAPATAPAPTEVISWRMWQIRASLATSEADQRHWAFPWGYQAAAARILEKSDGRLDIRVMTPAELGLKGPDVLRALNDNTIEMAQIADAFVAAEEPWIGIADLPFILLDPYLDNPKFIEVLKPYLDDVAAKYDFTLLSNSRLHAQKWICIYTKDRINTLDDLRGLKLRIYTPYHEGVMTEAGASPMFIPYAEVAMALKTGVIDGFMTSQGLCYQQHCHEAGLVYQQAVWAYPGVTHVAVSNKALDSLPADLKEIFLEGWGWFENENLAHQYNELFFEELLEDDRALGQVIIAPNPEFNALLEQYTRETDWHTYVDKAGPMGAEILDKVCKALGRPAP